MKSICFVLLSSIRKEELVTRVNERKGKKDECREDQRIAGRKEKRVNFLRTELSKKTKNERRLRLVCLVEFKNRALFSLD